LDHGSACLPHEKIERNQRRNMPLYTYVTSYKGAVHVSQGRHSNFKGFATWLNNLPPNALPALTPNLRKDIAPYWGDFEPLPNVARAWKKAIQIGDAELTVVAIETKS
jgi:hypothetical protein